MGKWYAGIVIATIALALIIVSMFMPWYQYEKSGANVGQYPATQNQTLDERFIYDNESHTMTTEYSILYAQQTSSIPAYFDTDDDGRRDAKESLKYDISTKASEENYRIPLGGPIEDGGRPAQLEAYNIIYFFYLIAMIAIFAAIGLLVLTGMGFLPKYVPKIPLGIVIALAVIAPFYFAFFQPVAVDEDAEAAYDHEVAIAEERGNASDISDYRSPAHAEFFMGTVYSKDAAYQEYDVKTTWGPGLGWYLAVGAMIFSIIAIGNTRPTRVRKPKMEDEKEEEIAYEPGTEPLPCPSCTQPMLFMKTAQAYYCNNCQKYADMPGYPAPRSSNKGMHTGLDDDEPDDLDADEELSDTIEW